MSNDEAVTNPCYYPVRNGLSNPRGINVELENSSNKVDARHRRVSTSHFSLGRASRELTAKKPEKQQHGKYE